MIESVLQTLRENAMVEPGDDVTVALSGGADSVALLAALRALAPQLGVTLRAAHFHHGIRGAEADRDEAFCRALCESWGVPFRSGRGDAAAFAAERGLSLETAARELRYAFLEQAAPGKLATAHNADDNAETLLLHLIRGAGPRGFGGIPPKRGRIIRPLLDVTRAEILQYLSENRIPHVEDGTNAADGCLRNRVRHRILPLLCAENPRFVEAAGRAMRLSRAEDEYLSGLAAKAEAACRTDAGYSVSALLALDPVLRSRVLLGLLRSLRLDSPTAADEAALEALIQSPNPSACATVSGGVRVCRSYDELLLNPPQPGRSLPPCALVVPGTTVLPDGAGKIIAAFTNCFKFSQKNLTTFAVKYDMIAKRSLEARGRRPGDRLTLSGGAKTVKALMIDRKIPQYLRGRLPLLLCEGRLIACFGLGLDPAFQAAPGEEALLVQFEAPQDAWNREEIAE